MNARFVLVAVSVVATSCTTSFYGSSTVSNGRAGCERACSKWKMELVGMVQMGEYSDGCICSIPGARASPVVAAGAEAAVAAVETARQESEKARAAGATSRPPTIR